MAALHLMAVRISPLQILAFLVLAALAVSGWVYGLRWKRVALGDEPTQMEALLIDLQDLQFHFLSNLKAIFERSELLPGDVGLVRHGPG